MTASPETIASQARPEPRFGLLKKTGLFWRRLFSPRPLNLLLVGTSNCMLKKGISVGLAAHPGVRHVENRSLGASSSIHLVKSTEDIDFRRFDFCLLDFSVNEDILLRSRAAHPELIETNLRHIVARCLEAGCMPVILIFPRKPPVEKNAGRTFYLEFARRFHLPVFDGYSLLTALKKKHRLEHEGLFENANHVVIEISELFARALAPELRRLSRVSSRFIPADWTWNALAQLRIAETQTPGFEAVVRSNSRFTESFFTITPENPLSVELADSGIREITGVAVNIGHTQGFLIIEGETQAVLDLRNEYCGQRRHKLSISILPLPYAIKPRQGRITLRCTLDETETAGCIGTMSEFLGNSTQAGPARVEISRLIGVSSVTQRATRLPAPTLHADLAASPKHQSLLRSFAKQSSLPRRPRKKTS